MAQVLPPSPEAFLSRFGLEQFRPGQREVIETVLAGQDCLCVMPTGGGKSLCYQLPALALDGVTLVVSPLIALMKDQVDQLQRMSMRATLINSTLSPAEQQERLEQIAGGQFDLVYVVPERFRSPRFLRAIRQAGLARLAIDEAHCVSEWGHDFRPDYARLGEFREQLGNPPTIALTATATDRVRQDVVELLRLREPATFITGFARPNLHYGVQSVGGGKQKEQALLEFLDRTPGSGIIYTSSRKRAEEVAQSVKISARRKTVVYHAGMEPEERRTAQEAFMQGRSEIVVATTAFGMGIDKADVRFVVHYNLPGTLEAYYQEAGRAGRDGRPSACLLLYHVGDRYIQEFFIDSAYPSREIVTKLYDFLRRLPDDPIERTLQEINAEAALGISDAGVGTALQLLEKAGGVERLEPFQNLAVIRINSDLPTVVDLVSPQAKVQRKVLAALEQLVGPRRYELVYFQPRDLADRLELEPQAVSRAIRELRGLTAIDYVPPFRGRALRVVDPAKPFSQLEIDFETLERRRKHEYQKLELMIDFARAKSCRQAEILHYFGEPGAANCGHCDNCDRNGVRRSASPASSASPAFQAPAHQGPAAEGPASPPGSRPTPRTAPQKESQEGLLGPARAVLSAVARTDGRFGKGLISQMLRGSRAERISRFKLDRLSTFGLLAAAKEDAVNELIDGLLSAGYLEQEEVERHRPVLRLTDDGRRLMRGEIGLETPLRVADDLTRRLAATANALRSAQPPTPRPTRAAPAEDAAYAPSANTRSAEPAPDDLLPDDEPRHAVTDARPSPRPAETRPAETRPAETRPAETRPAETRPAETRSEPPPRAVRAPVPTGLAPQPLPAAEVGRKPNHYWTWRLLAAGLTPAECAAARGLSYEVVLDHARQALDQGWVVEAGWFFSRDMLEVLEAAVSGHPQASPRSLLQMLPAELRREELELFSLCRQRMRSS